MPFWQLLKLWFHPDQLPPSLTMSLNMFIFGSRPLFFLCPTRWTESESQCQCQGLHLPRTEPFLHLIPYPQCAVWSSEHFDNIFNYARQGIPNLLSKPLQWLIAWSYRLQSVQIIGSGEASWLWRNWLLLLSSGLPIMMSGHLSLVRQGDTRPWSALLTLSHLSWSWLATWSMVQTLYWCTASPEFHQWSRSQTPVSSL